jgi:hypothetical protein
MIVTLVRRAFRKKAEAKGFTAGEALFADSVWIMAAVLTWLAFMVVN